MKDKMLQPGDKLYVIESQNQANPGRFAAPKQYSSLDQARRELALLPEWKDATQSVGLVVREYTVIKPTPIREGITGA